MNTCSGTGNATAPPTDSKCLLPDHPNRALKCQYSRDQVRLLLAVFAVLVLLLLPLALTRSYTILHDQGGDDGACSYQSHVFATTYLEIYYCSLPANDVAATVMLLLLLGLCFMLLGSTAEEYFCPALASLSEMLGLQVRSRHSAHSAHMSSLQSRSRLPSPVRDACSACSVREALPFLALPLSFCQRLMPFLAALQPRVAGVTLLALGNGAPDVFSIISSVNAKEVSMAVGEVRPPGYPKINMPASLNTPFHPSFHPSF